MDATERVADRYLKNARMKPIYTGVFLTPSAKTTLLHHFPAIHPKVFAHHVTTWFKKDPTPVPDLDWGATITIRVIGIAQDEKAQAVVVEIPVSTTNLNPHITVSMAQGVSPVYSNDLLKKGWDKVTPITITGRIGWFDGVKERFEPPLV